MYPTYRLHAYTGRHPRSMEASVEQSLQARSLGFTAQYVCMYMSSTCRYSPTSPVWVQDAASPLLMQHARPHRDRVQYRSRRLHHAYSAYLPAFLCACVVVVVVCLRVDVPVWVVPGCRLPACLPACLPTCLPTCFPTVTVQERSAPPYFNSFSASGDLKARRSQQR